jgi:multiple sugar transport system permease protein
MAKELMPGQKRVTTGGILGDLALVGWFAFSLFPVLWMFLLALKTPAEQTTTFFQFSPTLDNFITVLTDRGRTLTGVDFKSAILLSVLNSLMFNILSFRFAPELMVIIPVFVIFNRIGLFDTPVGMIWVLQLVTMPLVVWILRSYFQDMPEELEQAALLDGYTRKRAFLMVALPLVRPGIAASALLSFIFAWNNYMFPLILTNAGSITVTITKFLGGGGQAYYNLTAAAGVLGALPPFILALTIQRYLVQGLSFGAVKG